LALAETLFDVSHPLHIAFVGGHHVTGNKCRFVGHLSIELVKRKDTKKTAP
jgi:hypothetical protein